MDDAIHDDGWFFWWCGFFDECGFYKDWWRCVLWSFWPRSMEESLFVIRSHPYFVFLSCHPCFFVLRHPSYFFFEVLHCCSFSFPSCYTSGCFSFELLSPASPAISPSLCSPPPAPPRNPRCCPRSNSSRWSSAPWQWPVCCVSFLRLDSCRHCGPRCLLGSSFISSCFI